MARVAIDLRMLTHPLGGVARYALELARGLPGALPGLRLTLLGDPGRIRRHLPRAAIARAESRPMTLGEQFELPPLLDALGADLFHATVHAGPLGSSRPLVITIHDLLYLDEPGLYGWRRKLYLKTVARALATRARAVLTVSEFSRRRLVEGLGVAPEKITVTPCGIDPRFAPVEEATVERVREELGLPREYLLYVGDFLPHKNVPVLVRAYARLKEGMPPLVLCGAGYERVLALVAQLGLERRVRLLPGLTDRELPALYSGATAFVFPSRYEGFGLPPMEAMACGAPTIVAAAGSLPEVTGGAALQFQPDDDVELARRMQELIDSRERRISLGVAGRVSAARFRWTDCVEATARVYRDALGC